MTLPTNADPTKPNPAAQKTDGGDASQVEGKAQNQAEGDGTEDVVFDKDRALETIRKQRESERKLAKDLKDAQARLAALDQAEQAKKDAEKTELQKATERAAQLEAALQESRETAQALLLRQTFLSKARGLNLKFASTQAEEDAFELADLEGVEIDESGKITGLEDAIKALQASRPYLFSQGSQEEGGDKQGTPKRSGKPTNGKLNPEAQKTGYKVRF
jgi:hypothetical protein